MTDRKFTNLIQQSLEAGYFEFKKLQHDITGTPQGSIISPILCNIFLHELDVFIANLIENFDKGSRPRNTQEYTKNRNIIKRYNAQGDKATVMELYKANRKINAYMYDDPKYKRLRYVRYADDWLVGVRGSFAETQEILNQIIEFTKKIGLTMNIEKTHVTSLNLGKVTFLGTIIFRSRHRKYSKRGSSFRQRLGQYLRLTASLERIKAKLRQANFMWGTFKGKPKFL